MPAHVTALDIPLRLGLAFVAGALIGLDREAHAHAAGLRTTVLVAVAACLAMILANLLWAETPQVNSSLFRLDVLRLPLGVLSGIGFIGGGAILRRGDLIRGVTTAAAIWIVTVIGLCFGAGQLGLGAAGTALAIATLWLLRAAETTRLAGRPGRISITLRPGGMEERELLDLLQREGLTVRSCHFSREPDGAAMLECGGYYRGAFPAWSCDLVHTVAALPAVVRVVWHDSA